ncbi:MAG: hypothetical protein WDM78_06005 [Puia sp.]
MPRVFFCSLFLCMYSYLFAQSGQIAGFSNAGATDELAREKTFDDLISALHIGETIRDLSSRPHNVGSPGEQGSGRKNPAVIVRLWI